MICRAVRAGIFFVYAGSDNEIYPPPPPQGENVNKFNKLFHIVEQCSGVEYAFWAEKSKLTLSVVAIKQPSAFFRNLLKSTYGYVWLLGTRSVDHVFNSPMNWVGYCKTFCASQYVSAFLIKNKKYLQQRFLSLFVDVFQYLSFVFGKRERDLISVIPFIKPSIYYLQKKMIFEKSLHRIFMSQAMSIQQS